MKNRNFAIQLMLTQFLMVIIVCLEGVGVVDEFYAGIGAMLISAPFSYFTKGKRRDDEIKQIEEELESEMDNKKTEEKVTQ